MLAGRHGSPPRTERANSSVDEGSSLLSSVPLIHEVLFTTLPCSADEARRSLFAGGSRFFHTFLSEQGGSQIEIEPWAELRGGGSWLREIRRVQLVRSRFSPVRSTRVHETQRLGTSSDGAVVLALHQLSLDVPYADYFAVHTKLCLRDELSAPTGLVEGPDAACRLSVSVDVAFCKPTMLQSRITAGAVADIRDAYTNVGLPAMRAFLAPGGSCKEGGIAKAADATGGGSPGGAAAAGDGGERAPSSACAGCESGGMMQLNLAMGRVGPLGADDVAGRRTSIMLLLEPWELIRRMRARFRLILLHVRYGGGRAALASVMTPVELGLTLGVVALGAIAWVVAVNAQSAGMGPAPLAEPSVEQLRSHIECLQRQNTVLQARAASWEACAQEAIYRCMRAGVREQSSCMAQPSVRGAPWEECAVEAVTSKVPVGLDPAFLW